MNQIKPKVIKLAKPTILTPFVSAKRILIDQNNGQNKIINTNNQFDSTVTIGLQSNLCKSCGSSTHLRASSSKCPKNQDLNKSKNCNRCKQPGHLTIRSSKCKFYKNVIIT